MPTLKHSRQRDCIRDYLASTDEHPTADVVYMNVRKKFPNISLGTVYRNLNLLAANKEILKIPSPDGADRFDGTAKPHCHFYCEHCGKVLDLPTKSVPGLIDAAAKDFQGTIDRYEILFYGTCPDCRSNS